MLDEFYKQKICPNQIVNGAKILSMRVDYLKFINSMCFLQMPLHGFTWTEGIEGIFPTFFEHGRNQLQPRDAIFDGRTNAAQLYR